MVTSPFDVTFDVISYAADFSLEVFKVLSPVISRSVVTIFRLWISLGAFLIFSIVFSHDGPLHRQACTIRLSLSPMHEQLHRCTVIRLAEKKF